MKLTLITARNPVYVNQTGTAIDLIAQFAEIPQEVPFTATETDSEEHGREIYARAVAGEFGVVLPYVAPPPAPPSPVIVPKSVTMRQARLALLQAGLLAQIDAAITEPAARIEWEFAATVDRSSALVQQMSASLGLTTTQLDDLFILAATL